MKKIDLGRKAGNAAYYNDNWTERKELKIHRR